MKTFNDNTGNTWSIPINVGTIKRVRSLLDVNLLDAVEGKLLEQLIHDPILLCDIIYVVCEPDATKRGVSDDEFGHAMAGDAIDAATTALLEELVDFFPNGKRQILNKALAKLRTFETKALAAADKRLDDPELDRKLTAAIEKIESAEVTLGD